MSLPIAAEPRRVWDLISDVTRMGDWSPETRRCKWLSSPPGARAGARFRGHNRLGPIRWSTVSTVETAQPGMEFSFVARHWSGARTRWRYELTPTDAGTLVTESYEAIHTPRWISTIERAMGRGNMLEHGMAATLQRIRAAAERPA